MTEGRNGRARMAQDRMKLEDQGPAHCPAAPGPVCPTGARARGMLLSPRRPRPTSLLASSRSLLLFAVAVLFLGAAQSARGQDGPLGGLLRDLFGGGEATRQLDLVDRHAAAAVRELSRSLEQCDELVRERQWQGAIERLQYLVDLPRMP